MRRVRLTLQHRQRALLSCSANINRGPAICANGKYVRRDRVEEVVLQAIFEEVFSPDMVAYLSGKVNDALARLAARPSEARQRLQAELGPGADQTGECQSGHPRRHPYAHDEGNA